MGGSAGNVGAMGQDRVSEKVGKVRFGDGEGQGDVEKEVEEINRGADAEMRAHLTDSASAGAPINHGETAAASAAKASPVAALLASWYGAIREVNKGAAGGNAVDGTVDAAIVGKVLSG